MTNISSIDSWIKHKLFSQGFDGKGIKIKYWVLLRFYVYKLMDQKYVHSIRNRMEPKQGFSGSLNYFRIVYRGRVLVFKNKERINKNIFF